MKNSEVAFSSAANAVLAQAAVGGVRISSNDTTADDLETKLIAGEAILLTTQNDGANETRTVAVDLLDDWWDYTAVEYVAVGEHHVFGTLSSFREKGGYSELARKLARSYSKSSW